MCTFVQVLVLVDRVTVSLIVPDAGTLVPGGALALAGAGHVDSVLRLDIYVSGSWDPAAK